MCTAPLTWLEAPVDACLDSAVRPTGVRAVLDLVCRRRWWASRELLSRRVSPVQDQRTEATEPTGPCSGTDRWSTGNWSISSDTNCRSILFRTIEFTASLVERSLFRSRGCEFLVFCETTCFVVVYEWDYSCSHILAAVISSTVNLTKKRRNARKLCSSAWGYAERL